MAEHDGKRERLVEFLDRKAFNPILRKKEDDFKTEDQKRKFRDIKRSTQSEQERFHSRYHTAKEVKDNYLSDLNSSAAKKKNAELEDLGLPRLPEFREEFLELCEKLEVR